MRWECAHLEAVRHMVKQKGGLHKLSLPGLANAIALGDIFLNFQPLSAPSFPLVFPSSYVMSVWPYPKPDTVGPLLKKLGTGFRDLPECLNRSLLFTIIDRLREITIGYDKSLHQATPHPPLVRILWARNSLQHDLISLPERSDEGLKRDSCLYELCRLGTMAYTLLVLFPVPSVTGMHPRLAKQLLTAMDNCLILGMWDDYQGLLLWAIILCGTVADGTPSLRQMYVSIARWTSVKHNASAWNLVREICTGFLWL
ncbi:uncharacterized protein A1O9_00733 [Exophiala aquamarina CBS 119918]|uniref:Transcription factor domain-containing protein n=1 Tax=Exophiala aquamarina CBS 119918 TaxID=1182545 RepID=A0A072Q4E7_9EURO|nr:uncharacterized protein A1O9_00733 [Exophiala aquamarina CBS 119918]KEF62760.1 hypothetical protein A1O9_00733 [Exophiala aquamarina CBS 119918]